MSTRIAVGLLVSLLGTVVRADDRHLNFIKALQDHGYHDMVPEYMEQIRGLPNLPADVKALGDYVVGKSMLEGAEAITDLKKRDEQLQQARGFFEKFVREQPEHARVPEAQMDLAQILVERGRVAILNAENPNNQAKRPQFQADARGFFDEARKSFEAAHEKFQVEFKKFPPFIPETEKRQREAKREAELNVMQAHLHLGLVQYEHAQAYDKTGLDYKKTLLEAVKTFEDVHSRYRFLVGGLYARMWQGKCWEEMGELGRAEGFYKELLEHEDKNPAMLTLQRQVQFFAIIVLNKRGDHVLAADSAKRWLQENRAFRHTEAGLGVLFEQANAFIQQALAKPEKSGDRNRLFQESMTALEDVTRYESIYKQPAIVLVSKYKGMIGGGTAVVTYDKARSLADAALEGKNWTEAARYLSLALKFAKGNLDLDQLAYVRYALGFCYLQTKDYYQAAVLGEYVARHQPKSSVAALAGQVALQAYTGAYNEVQNKLKKTPDFEEARIVSLAGYLIKTWPTTPEANAARFITGELAIGHNEYESAAAAFESVTADSPDHARALGRAGDAFWRAYVEGAVKPAEERDADKLAAWLKKAQEDLAKSVAEQRKSLKPEDALSSELAEAMMNLAEVSLESGNAPEAIVLIKDVMPKIEKQKELERLRLRALIALLRGHVVTNELQAAQDTMQLIEKTGKDLAAITRILLELGKQLQEELDRIKARKDTAALERTRASYVAFLKQLAARQEGQTFVTLQWTGEAFFGLEMYPDAVGRFKEILARSASDPAFLDKSKRQNLDALTHVKLRLVTALRKQGGFSEAWELIKPLPKESNPTDDPLHKGVILNYNIITERGLVLQEWGDTEAARLKTAIDHWGFWAQRMEPMPQKPTQYFEIRLNLIRSMMKKAAKATDIKERAQLLRQAEQQIIFITQTSKDFGGPALKEQFKLVQKDLEKQLGRPVRLTEAAPAGRAAGN